MRSVVTEGVEPVELLVEEGGGGLTLVLKCEVYSSGWFSYSMGSYMPSLFLIRW